MEKNDKKMKRKWKKNSENCNFPKKWKIAIFLKFFFSFFSFSFIFFSFFFIFVSFCFIFFHFSIILSSFFHHFCFQWCKNFPKNEKLQFSSRFFHFFYLFFLKIIFSFFSCFIIFASSGAKIFQKMENCNFPRLFFICLSCFYHLFICFFMFHHSCFQWCKNFPKNWKLQFFSIFFHLFIMFYQCFIIFSFSSFLLPVVQKFSKKWKIAIFLGFFHFLSCVYHLCFQCCKNSPKNGKLQISTVFSFYYHVFYQCFFICLIMFLHCFYQFVSFV